MNELEESEQMQDARRWLTRARGQQVVLRRRLQQLLAEPACRLDVNEPAGGEETLYQFRPRVSLPDEVPYLAHDAARSLLRALDAFYSAVTSTRFGLLHVRRPFPFARSSADLELTLRRRLRSRRGALTGALAGLIRNTEPYPDGDRWIAALPAICACQTDQLLEVRAAGRVRITGDGAPYPTAAAIQAPAWQATDPALILRIQDPRGQFQGRYQLTQQAVFTQPRGVANCEVASVLGYQADVVEGLLDTQTVLSGGADRRTQEAPPERSSAQRLSG